MWFTKFVYNIIQSIYKMTLIAKKRAVNWSEVFCLNGIQIIDWFLIINYLYQYSRFFCDHFSSTVSSKFAKLKEIEWDSINLNFLKRSVHSTTILLSLKLHINDWSRIDSIEVYCKIIIQILTNFVWFGFTPAKTILTKRFVDFFLWKNWSKHRRN